jgi:hypothetical protein
MRLRQACLAGLILRVSLSQVIVSSLPCYICSTLFHVEACSAHFFYSISAIGFRTVQGCICFAKKSFHTHMPAIRARLRFLVHPVEQQNREHQNQQTEGNTGCAHTIDPSWRSPEPNGMGRPLFRSGSRMVAY